jgi:hypothetical protein
MKFKVIDLITGKEANIRDIAVNEEWAEGLMYHDMEGFFIGESGSLILADECGRYVFCPPDRFEIVIVF